MSARCHRTILSSFDGLITELRLVRRTLVRSFAELHFSCDRGGMISDNCPVLATEALLPSYTISYSKVQECLSSHWTTPTLQSAQVTVHSRKIEAARHTHDLISLPTSSHQQISMIEVEYYSVRECRYLVFGHKSETHRPLAIIVSLTL